MRAATISSFSTILAWLFYNLKKELDYLEITSIFSIFPPCRRRGEMFRFSNSLRVGPLRENTLWLGNYGSVREELGSLRSSRTMDSMYLERAKQLARVSPTGPHPAIITCELIFCIYNNIWGWEIIVSGKQGNHRWKRFYHKKRLTLSAKTQN